MTFPIAKVHKAHYVLMNIECDQETLDELEHSFKFNDAVLRHLIVQMTKAVTAPSPMMKEEKSRSVLERGGEAPAGAKPAEAPAPSARAPPEQSDPGSAVRLIELDALRYTPAGIPVVNFRLRHASEQIEAGAQRASEREVAAMAFDARRA